MSQPLEASESILSFDRRKTIMEGEIAPFEDPMDQLNEA